MQYKKKLFWLLPFLLLLMFFIIQFIGLRNHSQSFYFQDETEHITLGWMMSDYGKSLYKDLSTNHQPLPIIVGSLFSKLIKFVTLFQLIERLRIGMLLFNFLISIFIVFRFRWKGLLSVFLLQSVSYLFFGWYVLAESLVAPVVSIVVLNLLELFFDKKVEKSGETKENIFDGIVIGFSMFWLAFNLLPLWPFIAISSLAYLYKSPVKTKKYFLNSLFIFIALLFTQIPIFNWLEETFYHLIKYYLPYNNELESGGIIRLLVLPFSGLFYLQSEIARFLFIGTILSFLMAKRLFKNAKNRFKFILFFVLILLLNTRVIDVRKVFYTGFHLYPFIAGFGSFVSFFVVMYIKNNYGEMKKLFSTKNIELIFIGIIIISLLTGNMKWVKERKDRVSEHNIQYGEQQAFASALKEVKIDGDRLLTGADGYGYINMVSNLPLADRQNFYLDWAYRVPNLKEEFEILMKDNPPEFIYFKEDSSDYFDNLGLEDNYIRLSRDSGSVTDLYIHKEKVGEVTDEQWQGFVKQRFIKPI